MSNRELSDWLWTSDAMVEAMEGRPFGNLPAGVTGISIDSRALKPGEAFSPSRANSSTATILQRPPWRQARGFWLWRNIACLLSAIQKCR